MIIHAPTIVKRNGQVRVSARVEVQSRAIDIPSQLWISFPEDCAAFVTDRADGFIASLLLLAMTLREDVEARGLVSPRLLEGMKAYQGIFNSWFPEKFQPIEVTAERYEALDQQRVQGATASAFSGGVDSFYTLRSHLTRKPIEYGLFVHGFDIPLDDERTYSKAAQAYGPLMQRLGSRLITSSTNVREFSKIVNWESSHGSALMGVALVMSPLISRFYVPSSKTLDTLEPWGSDPRIDSLFSTETLQFVHHGAKKNRIEKIRLISEWSEVYPHLRVCWEKPDGLRNCCRCNNCVRTMLALELYDVLDRCEAFPLPLERKHVRNCGFVTQHERLCAREIISEATARGRRDMANDVQHALLKCAITSRVARLLKATSGGRRMISSRCIKELHIKLQERHFVPSLRG